MIRYYYSVSRALATLAAISSTVYYTDDNKNVTGTMLLSYGKDRATHAQVGLQ